MLYVVYLFVGVFGAQTLVGLIEHEVFGRFLNPAAVAVFDASVPISFVRDFFVGEYGLITMGLTYAIAIVLPVVATFFLIFGWLEDSGYIPRLAIFSDRIFRLMGLNGKAVLPMILGLGCDTMATMTTRILGTPKERLIAVLLLALGIPCSAQLATILGILGEHLVRGAPDAVYGRAGADVLRRVPGREGPAGRAFRLHPRAAAATAAGLAQRAGEDVDPHSLVPLGSGPALSHRNGAIICLGPTGALGIVTRAGRPVVTGLLGLPAEAAQVFVMGFLRRDYGAAGLFQMAHAGQLSGTQAVVALTVMTLFVPCVANFLMIIREQGMKAAIGILVFVTTVAVATGAGLNYGFRLFGVGF